MSYAEAVEAGTVTAWLLEHPAAPMPEPEAPEPIVWTTAEQLELWPTAA